MSRISPGTIIVGIFAVLFGLIGAYAVRQYLTQQPEVVEEGPPRPSVYNVPVTSIELDTNRPVNIGDIAILQLTADQIRERGLPNDYMTNPRQITGRYLRRPLEKGAAFVTTDFYPLGMGPSVVERLKPGFRAMTIPITNMATVAGMASPGSVVDVLFRTQSTSTGAIPQTTVTLLERVEILALGLNQTEGTRGNAGQESVTLAVTPSQANALKVVEQHGEMSLVLRGPSDNLVNTAADPQTLTSLLGLRSPTFSTEVYRGGKLEVNRFHTQGTAPMAFTGLPVGNPNTAHTSVTPQPVTVPVEPSVAPEATSIEPNADAEPSDPVRPPSAAAAKTTGIVVPTSLDVAPVAAEGSEQSGQSNASVENTNS